MGPDILLTDSSAGLLGFLAQKCPKFWKFWALQNISAEAKQHHPAAAFRNTELDLEALK